MADKYGILTVNAEKEEPSFSGVYKFSIDTNSADKAIFLARCVLEAFKEDACSKRCLVKVENQLGDIREILYEGYVKIGTDSYNQIVETVK